MTRGERREMVARAIFRCLTTRTEENYKLAADAAIKATFESLLEPDEGMRGAGHDAERTLVEASPAEIFNAMINHLLKEPA